MTKPHAAHSLVSVQISQAKTALDDAGVTYEEIDLGQYPKLLTEVKQATGRVTVPQVRLNAVQHGSGIGLRGEHQSG